jgi:hypothetical protein
LIAPATEGPTDPTLRDRAIPAIVSLYSARAGSDHATSRGVGFLVSSNGILVTARHVSEANAELFAFTGDGRKHPVTGYYGEDRDYDVAVLKIEGEGLPYLSAVRGLPRPEEWVAVVSPEPDRATVYSTGAVKIVLSVPNVWDVICTTIPVHPGQSGSPLLNARGEVVGIVCGNDNKAEDGYAGYAMPVGIVQEILSRKRAKPIAFAKRPRTGSSLPLAFDQDFRAAAEAMGHNDWTEAERTLKRALKRFPESPLVRFCLGLCQAKRQAWKQAENSMAKVVELKPESGLAWCVYGASLAARGRHAQSEAALRKSIQLQPPDQNLLFTAWELIARIDAERGNTNGVREALANLRSLDPNKAELCNRELQRQYPRLGLSVGPK